MSTPILTKLRDALSAVATFKEYKEPRRGRYGSNVVKIPSRKNDCTITCESLAEAYFCLELERRPDVASYIAHPITICFSGSPYRYTPDFLVQFSNGQSTLVEVKHDSSYQEADVKARISRYAEILDQHGWSLESLSLGHRLTFAMIPNLQFLYHASYHSNGSQSENIRSWLMSNADQRRCLNDLLKAGYACSDIAHALFYRAIVADLERPINQLTAVWANYENEN